MSRTTVLALMIVSIIFASGSAKGSNEILLSATENAYNPIPNQEGSLIAYVRTGWGRPGGSGGTGRSNLRSEVMVMTASGELLTAKPLADAFLSGWTADGKHLICYRDWWYALTSLNGSKTKQGRMPEPGDIEGLLTRPERVTFVSDIASMLWVQNGSQRGTLCTPGACLAGNNTRLGEFAVPSPNGRYIAVFGAPIKMNGSWVYGSDALWIYDRANETWANLGKLIIHPTEDWNYVQPTWTPWLSDSSRLAFMSEEGIITCSPDGKNRKVIRIEHNASGLVAQSPDGSLIAYVTFEPRPMEIRSDLKFWGGTTIRVVAVTQNSKPRAITRQSEDTTYTLRWLNNRQLVFDRIGEESFYKKARIWKVDVPR